MEKIAILILAAGLGKRTRSELPKVILQTSDNPLLVHVLETANSLNPDKIIAVTGYKRELVEKTVAQYASTSSYQLEKIGFAYQAQQNGTGDAVRCGMEALPDFCGTVIILCGDVPLLRSSTLKDLIQKHNQKKATVSLLTFLPEQPASYGRILRDAKGEVQSIIEAKDCTAEQLQIKECNAGIYAVDSAFLKPAVKALSNDNAQAEYYLTDIIGKAVKEGQRVASLVISDEDEVRGVNDLYDLHLINQALNQRRLKDLILSGVTIKEMDSVFIDKTVSIAANVSIGPNSQICGNSTIEEGVKIDGCCVIKDCQIKAQAHIKLGVCAEKSFVGPKAQVGPFAHLREGSELGEESRVGNFVETKKAKLAQGVKASHLTYLGDCSIGENTNIGAGTITCNYDGYNKHKTVIGKNAFIGSDTSIVAPVTVGDGAIVGAGSTITQDVEADSLALTRAPQISKSGWAKKKRESLQQKAHSHK